MTAMRPRQRDRSIPWLLAFPILACMVVLGLSGPVAAGPIPAATWLQFSFTGAGTPAKGCDPADPAGDFCIPSFGTPTEFLDAPPWTFSGNPGGATLTVTDAFTSGDVFEVFDFGVSLGTTTAVDTSGDCGDDPVPCLADPLMSHRAFALGAGPHSITIVPTESPFGSGSAFLLCEGCGEVTPPPPPGVPAPLPLVLLGGGLVLSALLRRRVHQ